MLKYLQWLYHVKSPHIFHDIFHDIPMKFPESPDFLVGFFQETLQRSYLGHPGREQVQGVGDQPGSQGFFDVGW